MDITTALIVLSVFAGLGLVTYGLTLATKKRDPLSTTSPKKTLARPGEYASLDDISESDAEIQRLLMQSGNPYGWTIPHYKAARVTKGVVTAAVLGVGGFLVGAATGFIPFLSQFSLYLIPGFVVLGAVWGWFSGQKSVYLNLANIRVRRILDFETHWANTLGNIALQMQSGQTAEDALRAVTDHLGPGVISGELKLCLRKLDLGGQNSLESVLEEMCDRVPYPGLRNSVGTLLSAERLGADGSKMLLSASERMRVENLSNLRIRVDEISRQIEYKDVVGKMSTAVLFAVLAPFGIEAFANITSGGGVGV